MSRFLQDLSNGIYGVPGISLAFVLGGTIAMYGLAQSPAQAKGYSVTRPSAHWKVVDKPRPGGVTTSVTTGWRPIKGWEHNIVEKNPNLNHWTWLGMQEMNKGYVHLAPGQVSEKGVPPGPPKYLKPRHIPLPVGQNTRHAPRSVASILPKGEGGEYVRPNHVGVGQGGGGEYVKPRHVATVIPPPSTNTYIKLSAPKTNIALSAPKTNIALAAPRTNVKLVSTHTGIQLAAPRTSVQLAAPQTHVALAAPQTHIQLAAPSVSGQLRARHTSASLMADPMAAGGDQGGGADSFSNPDPYAHNVYGLVRVRSDGPTSGASGHVKAKLLKHR